MPIPLKISEKMTFNLKNKNGRQRPSRPGSVHHRPHLPGRRPRGLDTYEANAALGLPEDGRDYTAAAQMLAALGIFELDLLSNNPDKAAQLRTLGLTVAHHVPTGVFTTDHNVRYLRTKVVRTQHTLPLTELASG